ncbi:50S ribosomal protein L24 [Candidatus Falkowbacteria bacterium]|jgi:large subunit ribosomal protein L24|nr:50S ribosomal protein L24 [Candidatus Falkowbacteria bacterium]MBT5502998.1 50S ribosomal protein L24 [Candidatus Falkowbacteria bacterium]MBT6574354.1 50S ribosomal protein L24 [Candidatus Falkowbacteria bacterium]MBT7349053.1 50S ribosomal protein L24 [Candidatus Falkowbacteria bacterium]MBT7500953.1 50S ribosomal protein L24 [Candidatus Falkowbacteria bacterium]
MRIKKGDKVQITKGKDRVKRTKKGEKKEKGNQGKIVQVLRTKKKVVVDGLNLRYKHVRPKREGEKGQRIEFPAPISISNVMLVCPKCSKATRVSYKLLDSDLKGKKKIRICKKCKEAID